ncbi:MAG: TolC family protein [Woeseiaceae bacterium]|nr:TolC family protein [Woeseiaceae bacterium]
MRCRLTQIALGPWLAGLLLTVQSGAAAGESLDDAWAAALAAHQQLAAATAERDAARYGLASARAERLPRLAVSGGYTQLDDAPRFAFGDAFVSPPIFSDDDFTMANAQVTLPLYTSGAVSQGIAAAQSRADAVARRLDAVTQDIRLGTAEHYVSVLRAERALDVARSNVRTLVAHTADAENRYRLGAVPHNDFLAASVTLADARQRELQAENRLDLAHAAYNRYLGRELSAPVALDDRLDVGALAPVGANVDALVDTALVQRPELDGLAQQAAALRAGAAAERAQSRPQLALTGNYAMLETDILDDDRFWMVGIGVQWNIFDSGRTRNRAAALAREAEAALHRRNDLQTQIALQVREAWLAREEALHRRGVADAAVEQAAENLRVVRDRYRAGAATSTDVLDAEALRAQALNNRDGARFDAALATLRLARHRHTVMSRAGTTSFSFPDTVG